jgi:hypothetical protein
MYKLGKCRILLPPPCPCPPQAHTLGLNLFSAGQQAAAGRDVAATLARHGHATAGGLRGKAGQSTEGLLLNKA